jgi:hypothetical protein
MTDEIIRRSPAQQWRDWFGVAPGDEVTYEAVHAGVAPHRARVERIEDDGLVVVDVPPGLPLSHLVGWDRVVGKTSEVGCQAESVDGHEHSADLAEYVGVCVRGHQRRGRVCGACARPLRGPGVVRCAECPEDDPRPRVLVLAEVWDEFTPRGGERG